MTREDKADRLRRKQEEKVKSRSRELKKLQRIRNPSSRDLRKIERLKGQIQTKIKHFDDKIEAQEKKVERLGASTPASSAGKGNKAKISAVEQAKLDKMNNRNKVDDGSVIRLSKANPQGVREGASEPFTPGIVANETQARATGKKVGERFEQSDIVDEYRKQGEQADDTIRLGGGEDQGNAFTRATEKLVAMREEETILGNAIRIATDWRTTIALAATAASLGSVALLMKATAVGSGAAVSPALTGLAKAGGVIAKRQAIVSAIPGLIGKTAGNPIAVKVVNAGILTTAKSTGLTTSLLYKAGMALGVAYYVSKAVDTYPFAEFQLAEASQSIGIAIYRAEEAGDLELVAQLEEYQREMLDLTFWEQVFALIPNANVVQAVKKNIAAALKSAAALRYLAETQKDRDDAETNKWAKIREDQEAYNAKKRAEDEAYYAGIDEEKKQAKKDERKEDEKFYADIQAKKEANIKREQEQSAEYWAEVRRQNAILEEQKRVADAAYWDNIREENAARTREENAARQQEEDVGDSGGIGGGFLSGGSNLDFGLINSGSEYVTNEEEEERKSKNKRRIDERNK